MTESKPSGARRLLFRLSSTFDFSTPQRTNLILWAAVLVFLVSRLLTAGGRMVDSASVGYALALNHFDITACMPPLPGYPVYLFAAKCLSFVGLSDAWALLLPGLLSAALAVFPLYQLTRRLFTDRAGAIAVFLYLCNPGIWIISVQPLHYAFLLYPFLFTLRMLMRTLLLPLHYRKRTRFLSIYAGTASLGILIGIDLYAGLLLLPLFLVSIYGGIRLRRGKLMVEMVNGLVVGILIWLIPFALKVSLADIINYQFDPGSHNYVPPALSAGLPLLVKFKLFCWDVLSFGFCQNWPDFGWVRILTLSLVVAAVLLTFYQFKFKFQGIYLYIMSLPLALFLVWKGNLFQPGSIILMIPVLIMLVAGGLSKLPDTVFRVSGSLLALLCLLAGISRAADFRSSQSPDSALASTLAAISSAEESVVFGGPSVRMLKYLCPECLSFGIRTASEMNTPVMQRVSADRAVFATSEIPGFKPDSNWIRVMEIPGNPYLFGKDKSLTVFRKKSDY